VVVGWWLAAPGLRQWRLQYSAPQAAGGHETRPYVTAAGEAC